MHIKCCETKKSTIPPPEYGQRCLHYLDEKFVDSGVKLEELTQDAVQVLRESEKQGNNTPAKINTDVVTEAPQAAASSPLHGAQKTPAAGDTA
jgi:hypothetical protein